MGRVKGVTGVGTGHGPGSRATQFKPGHPGRKGAKKGTCGPKKGWRPPCRLLRDMRWVYSTPASADDPSRLRYLRTFMEEYPQRFLAQFTSLEEAHLAAQPPRTVAQVEDELAADEGHARAVALVAEIIARYEQKRDRRATG